MYIKPTGELMDACLRLGVVALNHDDRRRVDQTHRLSEHLAYLRNFEG
jgi:hypothetical protein